MNLRIHCVRGYSPNYDQHPKWLQPGRMVRDARAAVSFAVGGQVIDLKHKRVSRSPYIAKGLFYLVQLDGEWMIKRYDTRKPRVDEKDAEYLTGTKMVGILESETPKFNGIDISESFESAAWFDARGRSAAK